MNKQSRWHANPDVIAAPHAEQAPWVRYTRMPPPSWDWQRATTAAITAYTPEEQTMNTAVHESAHAVFMAAGYQIKHIVLHEPGDHSYGGRAHVHYLNATVPWLVCAVTNTAGERAEIRWMREAGLWSPDRAWVSERLAWNDRRRLGLAYQDCYGKDLMFHGNYDDPGDYGWVMDRTDEALGRVWDRVLALAETVAKRRRVSGEDAARITGYATR